MVGRTADGDAPGCMMGAPSPAVASMVPAEPAMGNRRRATMGAPGMATPPGTVALALAMAEVETVAQIA